jgi:hypothetical protein
MSIFVTTSIGTARPCQSAVRRMLASLAFGLIAVFLITSQTWARPGVSLPSMDPETFKSACEGAGGTFSGGSKHSLCSGPAGAISCDNNTWKCAGSCATRCGRTTTVTGVVSGHPTTGNAPATASGPKVKSGTTTVPVKKVNPVATGSGHQTGAITHRLAHNSVHHRR